MMYIVVSIIIIYILLKLYISIKHPFWNRQPIFHIYNLYYWFYRGIVYKEYPVIDKKYYDMTICHYKYNNLLEKEKNNIKKFIVNNWYNESLLESPYMNNLNYISIIKNKGVICGELLTMNQLPVIYVDYLCVKKSERNKTLAPKLIYNFFLENYKESKIFLFKWENKNMSILPLCIYNVLHYNDIKIKYTKLTKLKIVSLNSDTLYLINEKEISEKFKVSIFQNINTIMNMINDNHVKIYAALKNNKLIGLYFFKKYKNNIFNCYSSINYDATNLFIDGFHLILNDLNRISLSIDDISDSGILIESLRMFKPILIETHSYYFYNYIKLSENSKDVFILN